MAKAKVGKGPAELRPYLKRHPGTDAMELLITDVCLQRPMEDALRGALQTDIEIETTETPESRAFNEILKSRGLKAAFAWPIAAGRDGHRRVAR